LYIYTLYVLATQDNENTIITCVYVVYVVYEIVFDHAAPTPTPDTVVLISLLIICKQGIP